MFDLYKGKNVIECDKCGCLTLCEEDNVDKLCYKCADNGLENTLKAQGLRVRQCVDCGKDIVIKMRARTIRCPACHAEEKRRIWREKKRKQRKMVV